METKIVLNPMCKKYIQFNIPNNSFQDEMEWDIGENIVFPQHLELIPLNYQQQSHTIKQLEISDDHKQEIGIQVLNGSQLKFIRPYHFRDDDDEFLQFSIFVSYLRCLNQYNLKKEQTSKLNCLLKFMQDQQSLLDKKIMNTEKEEIHYFLLIISQSLYYSDKSFEEIICLPKFQILIRYIITEYYIQFLIKDVFEFFKSIFGFECAKQRQDTVSDNEADVEYLIENNSFFMIKYSIKSMVITFKNSMDKDIIKQMQTQSVYINMLLIDVPSSITFPDQKNSINTQFNCPLTGMILSIIHVCTVKSLSSDQYSSGFQKCLQQLIKWFQQIKLDLKQSIQDIQFITCIKNYGFDEQSYQAYFDKLIHILNAPSSYLKYIDSDILHSHHSNIFPFIFRQSNILNKFYSNSSRKRWNELFFNLVDTIYTSDEDRRFIKKYNPQYNNHNQNNHQQIIFQADENVIRYIHSHANILIYQSNKIKQNLYQNIFIMRNNNYKSSDVDLVQSENNKNNNNHQNNSNNYKYNSMNLQNNINNNENNSIKQQNKSMDLQNNSMNYQNYSMNYQNNSMNQQNNSMNYQNNSKNYQNSSMNYQNNSMNYQNNSMNFQNNSMNLQNNKDFNEISKEYLKMSEVMLQIGYENNQMISCKMCNQMLAEISIQELNLCRCCIEICILNNS